jgi:hypothetical protein
MIECSCPASSPTLVIADGVAPVTPSLMTIDVDGPSARLLLSPNVTVTRPSPAVMSLSFVSSAIACVTLILRPLRTTVASPSIALTSPTPVPPCPIAAPRRHIATISAKSRFRPRAIGAERSRRPTLASDSTYFLASGAAAAAAFQLCQIFNSDAAIKAGGHGGPRHC